MRLRWPSERNQKNWAFVFSSLQAIAIVGGAIWGLYIFHVNSKAQQEAIRRELRKPYDEQQLSLYVDAARVLAHLSTTPDTNRAEYEARFWELYWGELPFVENVEVREKMATFCNKAFGEAKCGGNDKSPLDEKTKAAIDMSQTASCQVRSRWSAPKLLTLSVLGVHITTAVKCPPED